MADTQRQPSEEVLFTSEQRRYRRLEVSLPLWIAREEDFYAPDGADVQGTPWSLGYTRDVSMGGCKVIVPAVEERKWMAAVQSGALCLIRFDVPDAVEEEEYIQARVRHAAFDKQNGNFWLGVEYDEGARDAKAASLRAGLQTVKQRRRWQGAFVLALVVIALGGYFIQYQRKALAAKQAEVVRLQKQRKQTEATLSRLSRVGLVGTRAEGINQSFQSEAARKRLRQITANMARYSKEANQNKGAEERRRQREKEGIVLSAAPTTGLNVNLGVALPYGYAWPIVVSDLEEALGRRVPTIVVFRDFKSPFPIEDAREARVRAKTLQVTWEPHYFSNPRAISLKNIIAGKHDAYIDRWAQAAKSFGAEVWVRFAHEFNGNWYPWCVSNNNRNPKTYIAAYRHVRERFNRAGAFNVRWIWCLNAESVPDASWNDPLKAYPGDQYVDMISIDGYNFGTSLSSSRWQSFTEIFAYPYSRVIKKFPNKPVMIGEVGCSTVGGDKAAWIKSMDRALRTKFGRVQGVVWFEAQKEADWRMVSSPQVLQASRIVWNQNYYRRGES